MTDPLIGARYRLDGVIATVDAVHGDGQFDSHVEAVKQAAMADRLVLTKSDIAGAQSIDNLCNRLSQVNPAAPVIVADHGNVDPAELFNTGLYDPKTKTADVENWLHEEAYAEHHDADHDGHDHQGEDRDVNRHDDRIRAFCITLDDPVSWDRFLQWMDIVQSTRGESLLRIKGILNVEGEARPVAVHGVQHVFHPPAALPEWPSTDHRSKIVFITRDLSRAVIEKALCATA